jgi:hypothetical protein
VGAVAKGGRSRRERELASLAPWAWDPRVEAQPVGKAMMRDFSEVRPLRTCAFVERSVLCFFGVATTHAQRVSALPRGSDARA